MDDTLRELRKLLTEHALDGYLISSLPNITYVTGYTGFSTLDRDAFVLITKNSQYIFTHGIYHEDVKMKVRKYQLIEMTRENPISESLATIIKNENINKLGFEAFDLKVSEYERLTKHVATEKLKATNLIQILRISKTPDEIEKIKQACELGDACYSDILKKVRMGMTEQEIAAEMEFFIKKHGADISFPTIVAFGENAAHPHHMPTSKKLEKNTFVLLDFGILLDGYCSDMTRTFVFGEATEKMQHIYQTVLTAQEMAKSFIERKLAQTEIIRAKAADKIARDYMISQGFPSMPHSLGHGIGLEVHESPRLTPLSEELLEEGMVFSIEPGIYLAEKMGVRIEDLFAIRKNKLVQLTQSSNQFIKI